MGLNVFMHAFPLSTARQQQAARLPRLIALNLHLTRCLPSHNSELHMGKQKFYAVREGRVPGIYTDWASCQQQTNGFAGAVFKSFSSKQEAEVFLQQGRTMRHQAATAARFAPSRTQGSSSWGRFYAIAKGLRTGVFNKPWAEVEPLVTNYTAGRPSYRGFDTEKEAWDWLNAQSTGGQHPAAACRTGGPAKRQKISHDAAAGSTSSRHVRQQHAVQQQQQPAASRTHPQPANGELVVTMYFDGGSRGNPGRAGYGYAVFDSRSNEQLHVGCGPLPYGSTNNQAEYTGMIQGMKCALDVLNARYILVLGDSQLVVKHMTGEYRCSNQKLVPLFREAKALQARFHSFEIRHVYREENKIADQLSNLAMDTDTAVDKIVRRYAQGAGRAELAEILTEAAQLDTSTGDASAGATVINSLRTAPRFILAAATMLSPTWDNMPVPEVIARLTERGWDEGTGGRPVPPLQLGT